MSFELIEAEEAHYPKALMCRRSGSPAPGITRTRHAGHRGAHSRSSSSMCWWRRSSRSWPDATERRASSRAAPARPLHEQEAGRGVVAAAGPGRATEAAVEADDRLQPRGAIAPNRLQRDFTASAPDRVWVADTTFLPVLAGFIYLVVVIDLFSRKVVGWTVGDRLDAGLSTEALRRALARRRPRRV